MADQPKHEQAPAPRRRPTRELPSRVRELDWQIRYQYAYAAIDPQAARAPLIGRFEARRCLGKGGYGIVYLARDPALDRLVALKLCPTLTPELGEAFRREAQLLAKFSHPNIVRVFEIGQHGQDCFYAMEYIEGRDAHALIGARLDWQQVLSIYERAAAGLAAAHDKGIVHGDFKSSNLLLGDDGRVCVADFGLARLLGDGAAATNAASEGWGTLAYAAPELLRGQARDARSDQWAFCVALWEALHERRPFQAKTAGELLAAIERAPPRGLLRGVPWGVQAVLRRGLSVDPSQRYPDMRALASALQQLRRPPVAAPAQRGRRAGFGLGALVAGAAVFVAMNLGSEHTQAVEQADALKPNQPPELPAAADTEPSPPEAGGDIACCTPGGACQLVTVEGMKACRGDIVACDHSGTNADGTVDCGSGTSAQ